MAQDPEDIVNWLRLTAEVTTSGRIAKADVARLAQLGVREVINLALVDSPGALADEARLMRDAGIAYSHIPVPFDAPEEAHYLAFCEALQGAARPVHVHCMMNYRVSAFFYRWHIEHSGMAPSQARALMEQIWRPHDDDRPETRPWAEFVGRGGGAGEP